jgi:hypothetical protein
MNQYNEIRAGHAITIQPAHYAHVNSREIE